jgi:hypothetical protein
MGSELSVLPGSKLQWPGGSSRVWVICWPWAQRSVFTVIHRQLSCSLPQTWEPQATVLSTAQAHHWLNFSVGPHSTLLLSLAASYGCHLLRHDIRVSSGSLICDYYLFSHPQSSSISNNKPFLQDLRNDEMAFSPILACCTEEVTVTQNLPLGLRLVKTVGVSCSKYC